jgi:PadR family transcriptional regulator, regulatory protein PadR
MYFSRSSAVLLDNVGEMKQQPDTLGNFEQLVMTAVLALGDNAYGMAVHDVVEELGGKPVKLGSIYITLDRMEQKGLLSSWLTEPLPERGGRSKRCYRLEAPGKRALQEAAVTAKRIYETVEGSWRFGKWKPSMATRGKFE